MEYESKHWISEVKYIAAKDGAEAEKLLNEFLGDRFVLGTQFFQTKKGYDIFVSWKHPPAGGTSTAGTNKTFSDKCTEKQAAFLVKGGYEGDVDKLTKQEAYILIEEALKRKNAAKNMPAEKTF